MRGHEPSPAPLDRPEVGVLMLADPGRKAVSEVPSWVEESPSMRGGETQMEEQLPFVSGAREHQIEGPLPVGRVVQGLAHGPWNTTGGGEERPLSSGPSVTNGRCSSIWASPTRASDLASRGRLSRAGSWLLRCAHSAHAPRGLPDCLGGWAPAPPSHLKASSPNERGRRVGSAMTAAAGFFLVHTFRQVSETRRLSACVDSGDVTRIAAPRGLQPPKESSATAAPRWRPRAPSPAQQR